MVALSVFKLVKKYDFNMKNVIVLGIFYSFIIHGLKAFFFRAFLFPYNLPAEQALLRIVDRFLYGSLLVMAIATGLGLAFTYFKKGKLLGFR